MYDVLKEKWIPVIDFENRREELSLREVILHAHEYRELAEADSILECAMYRFLFTFVSDMLFYKGESEDEFEDVIESLYNNGHFSENLLDAYLDFCFSQGTSFDLFDSERPFMQNGQYSYDTDDAISVAKLCQRGASGTNKLFQCHIEEGNAFITNEEAVKLLLAQSPFNTPSGSGWGAGHFGAYPPLFSYVMGNSLYESLIFNLITNEGNERERNTPYWRMEPVADEKNTVAPSFSVYAAMFFPWRFTKLIPEKDSVVKRMFYVPGYKIEKTRPDILQDPYATYLYDKKGEKYLLCPKESCSAWRNIAGVFDQKSAPFVLKQYASLKDDLDLEQLDVAVYVTIVKDVHGTFTGAWKNRVKLPSNVLDPSSGVSDKLSSAVEYAEEKLKALTKSADVVIGKEDFKSIKPVVESKFYSVCRSVFFNDFLPALTVDQKVSVEGWRKHVLETTLDLYDEYVIEKVSGMEQFIKAYDKKRFLLDKPLKKGARR